MRLDRILYDYLGDVMLYQDWLIRAEGIEGRGEKSRVAIRRRMVRALVRTAADCDQSKFDGYYVFAHSLGTVVAFNGLMEPSHVLPAFLTQEEWAAVPTGMRTNSTGLVRAQVPEPPPWLKASDGISRGALLEKLDGFLTVGSPLDKFAALWPAIVPVCEDKLKRPLQWLNVSDVQDIVGASIDLLVKPVVEGGRAKGLAETNVVLTNRTWVGSTWLGSAHTSYWSVKAKRPRLMDRLIPWLEDGTMPSSPPHRFPPLLAHIGFWLEALVVIAVLFLLDTLIVHNVMQWCGLSATGDEAARGLGLSWPSNARLKQLYVWIVLASFGAVLVGATVRRVYEHLKFGRQYLRNFAAKK